MTFTSNLIVGLAAAVLAAFSPSSEVLVHPTGARGTTGSGKQRDACSGDRIEAATPCASATRSAPGPPTWWPGTPPCETVAAKDAKVHHVGDSRPRDASAEVLAVLAVAAFMGAAACMARRQRGRKSDQRHEQFRRVRVR